SKYGKKDPRMIEVILREAKRIVRMKKGVIIAETRHGFVCANAGVDKSNVKGKDIVSLLPINPDKSAQLIKDGIKRKLKVDVAVIISDTFGRPWREGQTNVAIGVAGLEPILDYRGKKDNYGYTLKATAIAIADELASAAELVMGKLRKIPIAIIRGYKYNEGKGSIKSLIRPRSRDLFS
ncbi:MAG: coenzyme F420-0:L-glutamate ligase, partial [Nitrososphaerales archaeon]